ncbi:MAG: isopentenyl-diphosphate Delta-isomerase [Candidatus Micrarchaeota archaeon]|nr:isopentenyl-diphosphate Delta-isomerase [Candidatus Micrarchaeota archaeon]
MPQENPIFVMLVDEKDNPIGTMEKLAAHQNGATLHRAFSVCLFNSKGETLMQQRAMHKYHSKGKWSNTCCSHPMVGESILDASRRRVREELGIECGELQDAFSFIYKVEVGDGLTEHEYDHVVFGRYDGPVRPNPEEVMDYKWAPLEELQRDIKSHPENYTGWLRIAIDRIVAEGRKFAKLHPD